MNLFSMNKWILSLALMLGSLLTLPAYAWPEVDHMNMCGAPTKAVQGGFKNWAQYDRYVAKRGNAYYLRTNCPNIVAPVKQTATTKKLAVKKRVRIAKLSKAKRFKRRAKYNEQLDCARVDRMNGYTGPAMTMHHAKKKRSVRPVVKISYRPRPKSTYRRYNYFKK